MLRVLEAPTKPIIITIADPPSELGSLGRVLLGSLGLAGTLVLVAAVLAVLFGGLMFWVRSRGTRGIGEQANKVVE
ncbi:MAG: hypothetical protein ABUS56_02165 [Acidobacteriota bacterium]